MKNEVKRIDQQISENLALQVQNIEGVSAELQRCREVVEGNNKEIDRCRTIVEGKDGSGGCQGDIKQLQEECDQLDGEVRELYNTSEEREQYSRREILEIHGVPESRGEDTNRIALDIFHSMGLRINRWAISRSHRQRIRGIKPSPIYVKLVNHDMKDIIYGRRNVLRKMPRFRNVFIDENLTAYRRGLFRTVRKEIGTDWRVRTYDGAILLSRPNSNKEIKVTCYNQFYSILESQNWE